MIVDFPIGRLQLAELKRAATAPHEGAPVGVPYSFTWADHGSIESGLAVPLAMRTPFVSGWGQCFAFHSAGDYGSVQVRCIKVYVKIAGVWNLLVSSDPQGGLYAADFGTNNSTLVSIDTAGVMSSPVAPGQALRFFTASRPALPAAATAMAVVFQARADVEGAFLIGAGADYWPSDSAVSPSNAPIGEGQLCFVTSGWEWYGVLYEA